MTQPTLGLLERLRPPPGFWTEAALGATYSADLLTCMAVLTTMDGGDGEQVRYGRVEAYRALDLLREKVRICHQAGRVSRRDGAKYPSLALLDRVLVPIRLPGRGSFHPKVWLVRQMADLTTIAALSRARGADDGGRRRRDASYGVARDSHPVSTIR